MQEQLQTVQRQLRTRIIKGKSCYRSKMEDQLLQNHISEDHLRLQGTQVPWMPSLLHPSGWTTICGGVSRRTPNPGWSPTLCRCFFPGLGIGLISSPPMKPPSSQPGASDPLEPMQLGMTRLCPGERERGIGGGTCLYCGEPGLSIIRSRPL